MSLEWTRLILLNLGKAVQPFLSGIHICLGLEEQLDGCHHALVGHVHKRFASFSGRASGTRICGMTAVRILSVA